MYVRDAQGGRKLLESSWVCHKQPRVAHLCGEPAGEGAEGVGGHAGEHLMCRMCAQQPAHHNLAETAHCTQLLECGRPAAD